ncbi:MAG TPA: hypothetical protein DCR97_11560 [Deltaproteobacteria bacterium]|nr:hypothetical protein [Deltaproteobacteria bacterium]
MEAYSTPTIALPSEPDKLQETFGRFGQLDSMKTDSGWMRQQVAELHEDGNFALSQLMTTVQKVKDMDLSELRDEVAEERRMVPLLEAKRALMTFLKKHVEAAQEDVKATSETILRPTAPLEEKEPVKAVLSELRQQEIRGLIRSADPKDRRALISGKLDFIRAATSSPDPLIDPEALLEIRRQYAFDLDPSLQLWERDRLRRAATIRQRAAEINATSIRIMNEHGFKTDPLPPEEFYSVFTPRDEHEASLARQRVIAYEREQDKKQRAKDQALKERTSREDVARRRQRL